jgi:hypothetical protein
MAISFAMILYFSSNNCKNNNLNSITAAKLMKMNLMTTVRELGAKDILSRLFLGR